MAAPQRALLLSAAALVVAVALAAPGAVFAVCVTSAYYSTLLGACVVAVLLLWPARIARACTGVFIAWRLRQQHGGVPAVNDVDARTSDDAALLAWVRARPPDGAAAVLDASDDDATLPPMIAEVCAHAHAVRVCVVRARPTEPLEPATVAVPPVAEPPVAEPCAVGACVQRVLLPCDATLYVHRWHPGVVRGGMLPLCRSMYALQEIWDAIESVNSTAA